MVLISLADRNTFLRAIICYEVLQAERKPNIKKARTRHNTEPECSIVNFASSVVSVTSKHTSNCDTPLNCFVC